MRQTSKTRRTIGIRGQLMGFLCFICLLLVGLFWFLSTQLLEPLYTTHIQKQLTEQAEAIVARMDEAIGKGETLSYWAFGSRLYQCPYRPCRSASEESTALPFPA